MEGGDPRTGGNVRGPASRARRPTATGPACTPPSLPFRVLPPTPTPAGAILLEAPWAPHGLVWTPTLAPSSGAGEGTCRSAAGWGWREKSEVLSLGDLPGEESCAPDHLEFIRKWEPWVHPDSMCCIRKDLFPASSENNQMGPNRASEINPQRHLGPFKSFLS